MADLKKGREVNLSGGFDVLVKEIEKLANIKVNLNDKDYANLDLKAMRHKEAVLASKEIASERSARRLKYINDVHSSRRIDPKWTFESISIDRANEDAIRSARGVCMGMSDHKSEPLLFLIWGASGSGKSVLCHAIGNELLVAYGFDVIIASYDEIKRSRLYLNADTADDLQEKKQRWQRYVSVDILIMDSLSANKEQLSVYDQKIMIELLKSRKEAGLSMFIATPVAYSSFRQTFGDGCCEAFKDYSVITSQLLGGSRRQPIIVNGAPLI